MPTYNTLVPVVALIDADSPEKAIALLKARIRSRNLEPYDGGPFDAFESEPLEEDTSIRSFSDPDKRGD